MKNRENRGAPSADLLACFPSRARLALLPKPICSPARSSEPTKRHPHHRRKRSAGGGIFSGAGQLSPVPWAKMSKQIKARDGGGGGGGPESSEPTSPKVTCAGQIKARPSGPSNCSNWQSVMEEFERIHSNRKQRTLGFKKEVMQFLTCLRSIRFDFNFRCLGSFPALTLSSDDEDEEEVEEDDEKEDSETLEEGSRTVFSKWFTALQEDEKKTAPLDEGAMVPPANALLRMRCRSAPAQSRLKRRETEEEDGDLQELKEEEEDDEEEATKEAAVEKEENRRKKKRESLEMVMKYDSDFYKLGSDDEIAKETWVDSGLMETLCRSRSCKR